VLEARDRGVGAGSLAVLVAGAVGNLKSLVRVLVLRVLVGGVFSCLAITLP